MKHNSLYSHRTYINFFVTLSLLFFLTASLSSCKGGLCAAKTSGLSDVDSDCSVDTGDNCPTIYNPDQYDADSDGLGWECDTDDTNRTIGMSLERNPQDIIAANLSLNVNLSVVDTSTPTSSVAYADVNFNRDDGYYFLVSCDGNFLGVISSDNHDALSVANRFGDYGSSTSQFSVLNTASFYGRSFTSCSAFNAEADYPPSVYFAPLLGSDVQFVGSFTTNPDLAYAIDVCDSLAQIGVTVNVCESI